MTYGIQIRNAAGDNLVDYGTSLTYYKKSSGTCTLVSSIPNSSNPSASMWFYPADPSFASGGNGALPTTSFYDTYNPDYYYRLKTQLACSGIGSIYPRRTGSLSGTNFYFPRAISSNKDDIIFFKIPNEGTIGIYQMWFPFTGADVNGNTIDVGLRGVMTPDPSYTGGALPYYLVSTDLPASTSNYGLRVYDSNGSTIMFDTTRNVAQFKDHIFISAATAADIINNNTSRTFNLRSSINNLWLAADGSGASNYKIVYSSSGADLFTLRVRKTGSTQVTVSRTFVNATSFSWSPYSRSSFNDALFLVADYG